MTNDADKRPTTRGEDSRAKGGIVDRVRRLLEMSWVQAVLIVLFGVLTVALAVSGPRPRTPTFSADDVGRQLAEPLFATHEFTYVQSEDPTVEARRQAALESVRPIWTHDYTLADTVAGRVRLGFHRMRCDLFNALAPIEATEAEENPDADRSSAVEVEAVVEGDAETPEDAEPSGETEDSEAQRDADGEGTPNRNCWDGVEEGELSDDELIAAVCTRERRAQFAERVRLANFSEDHCRQLALARFSNEAQGALQDYILHLMGEPVVDSLQELREESGNGILLRVSIGGEVTNELVLDDLSRFAEVGQLRQRALEGPAPALDGLSSEELRDTLRSLAGRLLEANASFDQSATLEAQQAAVSSIPSTATRRTFFVGDVVMPQGESMTARDIEIINHMAATAPIYVPRAQLAAGIALVLALIAFVLGLLARGARYRWSTRDITMMGVVLLLHTALLRASIAVADSVATSVNWLSHDIMLAAAPFAAGAMVVRILTNSQNALAYSLLLSLVVASMTNFSFGWLTFALISCALGVAAVRTAHSPQDILDSSRIVGAGIVLLTGALVLLREFSFGSGASIVALIALIVAVGIVASISNVLFVNGSVSLLEGLFRYTTPARLLRLLNSDHPLRRELGTMTPGTFQHTNVVADLVEAGCETIGADALLGRVGAYFHDIGKMKRPEYFGENQHGYNYHDDLDPYTSAEYIKEHVSYGLTLAQRNGLPVEIIAFIREHHGTGLIRAFYVKAKNQLGAEEVSEADFRYPGPRPQSRETGVCLMADGVEAAVRSMPEKTPESISMMVDKLVDLALTDGQLDECKLTLLDIQHIKRAFVERLCAVYHQRPSYPTENKGRDAESDNASEPNEQPRTPASA